MAYTLSGRLQSRLAAALVPLLARLRARRRRCRPGGRSSSPALMLGVGLAARPRVYDRLLDYQPGWLAVPLGLLELAVVLVLVRGSRSCGAPLLPALAFYAGSWLLAQALAHAGFPLLRLVLRRRRRRARPRSAARSLRRRSSLFGTAGGVRVVHAPAGRSPSAGIHQGPIVIDEARSTSSASRRRRPRRDRRRGERRRRPQRLRPRRRVRHRGRRRARRRPRRRPRRRARRWTASTSAGAG